MAVAATIDAVIAGITAAIEASIEAAIEAGIEAAVEEGVSAAISAAVTSSLVGIGVAPEIAAGMAEEFVGLELDELVSNISQYLIRALSIIPEAPVLLFTVPTVASDGKSVPHPVEGFAKSIGGKLSPKLKAELQSKVKAALKSAESDAMKYLKEQKKSIIKTSLIPFYGWVEGPKELSKLKGNTMAVLNKHANANIAKLEAQWKTDSVVQKAIEKDVEDFEKTDEWKKYVSSLSSGGGSGDKTKKTKKWDGSVVLDGHTADSRVKWLMDKKKNLTIEAAREKVRSEFPEKMLAFAA
jgi:hypothetical protein